MQPTFAGMRPADDRWSLTGDQCYVNGESQEVSESFPLRADDGDLSPGIYNGGVPTDWSAICRGLVELSKVH